METISSNVSAQSCAIYCLCEILKNENHDKLLEKMYVDVPDLFVNIFFFLVKSKFQLIKIFLNILIHLINTEKKI
jgi:hypothetical protein